MSADPTLADIGEFSLISQLVRSLTMPPFVSVGPGDDAAVYLVNGSSVTSVDMLVENVDFRKAWSSPSDIGRKSVAVNVADIEAMGAVPRAMVIALGLPSSTPVTWVKEFFAGMREESDKAHICLVGGDISQAEQITVSLTAIGETQGRQPIVRSGAHIGDIVAYRGRLGWAAAGLAALRRGFRSPRAVVDAQRHPDIPYGAGVEAAEAGATSMIDISDGLIADLYHVATASNVTIALEKALFTVDDPVATVSSALNIDPLDFLLNGGEDHALVATFPPDHLPENWQPIGTVIDPDPDGSAVIVDQTICSPTTGWQHFAS